MGERFDFTCSAPRFAVPPGACDTHMHVFGPPEKFPYSPKRTYTPPDATLEDYQAVTRTLGITRTVFVQPSAYADDNRCMVDAMLRMGEPARGVVVVKPDVAESELERLHDAGARGVRLNMNSVGQQDPEALVALLGPVARRIAPYDWHIQGYVGADMLPVLPSLAEALPVDLVLDHMGSLPGSSFEGHKGWPAMRALLDTGKVWVKLSGAYRVNDGVDGEYGMVPPLAQALIEAAPERMVWGSDWPHTPHHGHDPVPDGHVTPYRGLDTGGLLDLLADWAREATTRQRILVDNPAALYDYN
ncbi:MAG: amidohydrolase family protein [Acetobacterales bacterium]